MEQQGRGTHARDQLDHVSNARGLGLGGDENGETSRSTYDLADVVAEVHGCRAGAEAQRHEIHAHDGHRGTTSDATCGVSHTSTIG